METTSTDSQTDQSSTNPWQKKVKQTHSQHHKNANCHLAWPTTAIDPSTTLPALTSFTIPNPALLYAIQRYPTLFYPTISYPTLSYPASLHYPTLPYPTLPHRTLPYPTLHIHNNENRSIPPVALKKRLNPPGKPCARKAQHFSIPPRKRPPPVTSPSSQGQPNPSGP